MQGQERHGVIQTGSHVPGLVLWCRLNQDGHLQMLRCMQVAAAAAAGIAAGIAPQLVAMGPLPPPPFHNGLLPIPDALRMDGLQGAWEPMAGVRVGHSRRGHSS